MGAEGCSRGCRLGRAMDEWVWKVGLIFASSMQEKLVVQLSDIMPIKAFVLCILSRVVENDATD